MHMFLYYLFIHLSFIYFIIRLAIINLSFTALLNSLVYFNLLIIIYPHSILVSNLLHNLFCLHHLLYIDQHLYHCSFVVNHYSHINDIIDSTYFSIKFSTLLKRVNLYLNGLFMTIGFYIDLQMLSYCFRYSFQGLVLLILLLF